METTVYTTKALADGNRLRVVAALAEHPELCVCQLTEMLQLAMPTVSRHMSVLQRARLVDSRRDGRWIFYRLSETFPPLLLQWIRNALANSAQIAGDRTHLETIVACDLQDLCRVQKTRKPRSGNAGCGNAGRVAAQSNKPRAPQKISTIAES